MESKPICPICRTVLQVENNQLTTGDYQFFDCPRCGKFAMTRSALNTLQKDVDIQENAVLLSFSLSKMHAGNAIPRIDSYLLNELLKGQLPSLSDQINNLILWLGDATNPGEDAFKGMEFLQTIMGARTEMGARLVINHLNDDRLVEFTPADSYEQRIMLTMPGWEYYDKLKRGSIMSRRAFMAMKYGDDDLEWMFENCFKPAVKATGFDLYRLDKDPKAGLIDDQLRVEIRTSRFLISDLTHDNAGAYWEAGFAEGLGKPVIYICEKQKFEKEKTHFDTSHQKTFKWERDNPEEILNQLKATIRATLPAEAVLTDAQ